MNRRRFLSTSVVAGLALATRAAAPDRKPRVAVIGHTGRGNYGHGLDTMWLHLPETEIVAVADADATGLAAAQNNVVGDLVLWSCTVHFSRLKAGFRWWSYQFQARRDKPDVVRRWL